MLSISPDLLTDAALTLALFLAVGFFAQLVDGAVGMAYGVISSSALIFFGVPPAQASATIHAAECFTTGASGLSHIAHRNVDWRLFFRLAPAGIVGGVLGAYIVTGFEATMIKALVVAYLGCMGLFMLWRALAQQKEEPPHLNHVVPVGVVGGFLDASGGGGWGPVVTSTLLGRGHAPRFAIGSVNAAEFFVTVAISATFIATILSGRMDLGDERNVVLGAAAFIGLVLGGVVAAPLAGYVTRVARPRVLLGAAAVLVVALSIWQGVQVWPKLVQQPLVQQFAHALSSR
jgi:uncharacterized membrane protein YfcA